eukprot:2923818-Rhodomonas_salina.2
MWGNYAAHLNASTTESSAKQARKLARRREDLSNYTCQSVPEMAHGLQRTMDGLLPRELLRHCVETLSRQSRNFILRTRCTRELQFQYQVTAVLPYEKGGPNFQDKSATGEFSGSVSTNLQINVPILPWN